MVTFFGFEFKKAESPPPPPTEPDKPPVVSVHDLDPFAQAVSAYTNAYFDGDKFPGGFGATQLLTTDYWTLRERSSQLFEENLYARGLIRRLITNEINTGLSPESTPDEEIIGVPEDSLTDWSETVENRFAIWGKNPELCDFKGESTFGAIQRKARNEALVAGDVLVVLRQSQKTRLPRVQLIKGGAVRTPLAMNATKLKNGHRIVHGVELDKNNRKVAFWIDQKGGGSKRLPAFGEKSGRRIAWLVYGTDKRLDAVRGQPLLSLVLQSLKEIDRYRDAVQRKAVVNSILAMFIKKTEDKPGTLPWTGGVKRKETETTTDNTGKARTYNIASKIPGVIMEELQVGETPEGFHAQGIDLNFGAFEEAIIQTVAWANNVPPEILRLAFSNNYSASQAAINEFKIYLNLIWADFGETFCTPIHSEWLLSEILLGKTNAPGFLEAWRDPSQYDVYGAWISTEWYGSIKPSTDMLKQAKGSKMLIDEGWSTNAREARATTGTKFSKNIKRLKRENELKVEAATPLAEFQQKFGVSPNDEAALSAINDNVLELLEREGA